jgi:hypothetical protein
MEGGRERGRGEFQVFVDLRERDINTPIFFPPLSSLPPSLPPNIDPYLCHN